ncbi:MAG: TolB family protein, partial [Verrucomicrobiota bacterium]
SDARFEAYLSNANGSRKNNNTNAFQVYLADHELGVTNLVSGNASGPAGWCDGSMPSITEDGRFVVFESMDSTLVENDHNHAMDVFLFDSASNHIDLISARSPLLPAHSANGYTTFNLNSLSANGERIVYTSWATNLVQNDTNDAQDVFLYDFSTGSNRLVSAGALMSAPAGASSAEPAISGNGLEIAFTTLATDLTDGDTNKAWDIFLQDSITGSNQLVSLSKEGTFLAKSSYTPSLSKDGRYLAFVSEALNVAEITDFNSASDVFVRDLLEGTTRLASVSTNLSKTPSAASYSPVISPDGNHVAFISKALGIVREGTPLFGLYLYNINEESLKLLGWARFPGTFNANSQLFLFETLTDQPELGDTNNYSDVFLYDLAQEKLELISINLDATSGNAASHIGSITPDGRYVVFTSAASDLATNDNNGTNDVFLRDRVSGVTILISHNSLGEAANGDSDSPSISSDGKLIAYRSSATDLVDDEIRAGGQIYVYDVTTGQTRLITRSISGNRSSNARAGMPLIRPDGSGIIFKSFATDIVPTKGSSSQDIYYVSLLPGALEDSDMDGLPDGWERSYFGDLTHNGSVDTDSDGQSDLAEFLCGTDPKNTQSVFAGTGIGTLEDGKIVLQWASQPGKRYMVQFKDSLNAEAWTNVGEEIEATTTVTEATDPSSAGNPHRYYRIMLVH